MSERLKGKNAIVTGAGHGVGKGIALALAAEGANVVVNDLGGTVSGAGASSEPANEIVEEIRKQGGIAIANFENVADFTAAERIIKSCVENFGSLDILVNVAGILRDRMIWNMTEEEWDAVIAVHLKGTFNTCRHACRIMREQRSGRIINTTSGAWLGVTGHVNYCAAKGGIVSLTRAIAREMGRFGVTCNCYTPFAATRMTLTEDVKASWRKRVETGVMTQEQYEAMLRMPGPEGAIPIVVYLATDEAANVNGQVFWSSTGKLALYSEPVEVKGIYKERNWTLEELMELFPNTLGQNLINPAPPEKK